MQPTWTDLIIEVTPFIHPDFGKSGIVVVYNFTSSSRKGVGSGLSEHMSHVGTCHDEQRSATHPDLFQRSKVNYERLADHFWDRAMTSQLGFTRD